MERPLKMAHKKPLYKCISPPKISRAPTGGQTLIVEFWGKTSTPLGEKILRPTKFAY